MNKKARTIASEYFLLGLMFLTALACAADDYSTTDASCLGHFWAMAETNDRPVSIVAFGDSMSDSYRSPTYHLMNALQARLGVSGYSLNNFQNSAMVELGGAATSRERDQYWFSWYYAVPVGGAVSFTNGFTPGGIWCDQVGLAYVRQETGGQFRFLISTNLGPWGVLLTLDGYSSSPVGVLTNVAMSPNQYRIRVESDSGTNFVIGPSVLWHTNGVHAAFMNCDGLALNEVTNVARAIRDPIMAGLKPDLIVWHMKENGWLDTSNGLEECESWWAATARTCDVAYLGTTWVASDTNTTFGTIKQNALVRGVAVEHRRAYVDLMQPTVSYDWLATNGYMDDTIHLSSAGGLYCANLIWNELGFFALKLPRTISLQRTNQNLTISFAKGSGAHYTLQESGDLGNWFNLGVFPGDGRVFSTNLPASSSQFFRIDLSP